MATAHPTSRPPGPTEIRDAATVIVVRDRATQPRILMGTRGSTAAFMPNKVVFPGGAVDAADHDVALARPLAPECATRLAEGVAASLPDALAAAAVRELWEETGQILGARGAWSAAPPTDWQSFAAAGYRPSAQGLHFVFRAITPPGRPRRFDARFFLADADALATDPDDFSNASDELSGLGWLPLAEVRDHDLPFITQVVLAEVAAQLQNDGPPASVPFFRNDDEKSLFLRLHGTGTPD